MKILRFDSTGGASGDMVLAVMFDLGASPDKVASGLSSLNIGTVSFDVEKVSDGGINGLHVGVRVDGHDTHGHHGHHHRSFGDIAAMIDSSSLPPGVRELSIRVFRRLAEAEAEVHGTTPEKVHFHEVGALDSIVDITASCLAFEMLGIDRASFAALPLGTGTTQCQHGTIPVPAPATLKLLKDFPVRQTDQPFELVTPTGAALLTTWASAPYPTTNLTLLNTGYGFGTRRLQGVPNLLRGSLMASDSSACLTDECSVLECNIDDTTPEVLGSVMNTLMAGPALDVYYTPIQMKKNRPATLLTVLCAPSDRDKIIQTIFKETTTFGIREKLCSRNMLHRRHETVHTEFGDVRMKIGSLDGKDITLAPEHEDCLRLARETSRPLRAVYEAACRAAKPHSA